MRFTLGERQDLMTAIRLQTQGALTDSIQLSWLPIPRAHAYHLHAMGMAGQDMVLWSSADNGDAGLGLFDYLTESTSARWVKDKVLLSPETTECAVPQGIFAGGQGAEAGGGAMLRMIAYGPESHLSHPVKPANAPKNWQPEWTVRVRTKSQTMAMLGMDMSGMASGVRHLTARRRLPQRRSPRPAASCPVRAPSCAASSVAEPGQPKGRTNDLSVGVSGSSQPNCCSSTASVASDASPPRAWRSRMRRLSSSGGASQARMWKGHLACVASSAKALRSRWRRNAASTSTVQPWSSRARLRESSDA